MSALLSQSLLRACPLQQATSGMLVPLTFSSAYQIQWRSATKRGGGSTRNGRDSAGRRLGLKKSNGQEVIPGNILVRQRGFSWHPGQHVGVGVDHTLYALVPGYVKYYKATKAGTSADGQANARAIRKFCGIVVDRDDQLPRNEGSEGRSRRQSIYRVSTANRIDPMEAAP